jgi:Fe(3+) dicitrate transport protein
VKPMIENRSHLVRAVLCALVASLLPFGSGGFAQETAQLTARVTSEAGDPIAGARVEAPAADRTAVSDSAGWAVLDHIPAGRLQIEISAFGWETRRLTVELAAGEQRTTEVVLGAGALRAPAIAVVLDRFSVVGGKDGLGRIHGSAHYLGPEELARRKLLYDDVNALLRAIPGVNIQEEEGYGLRPNIGIRGTGSERSSKITLMEDGVLIAPAPYAAPAAYYAPVAGRMNAIEIRKGSSQVKYGPHTIGGAINFVSTPIPDRLEWFGDFEAGADETGKAWVGAGDSHDHFGWLAETYQIRTSGFKELDGGGNTGFDVHDYRLKLRINTDREARLYQQLEIKLGAYDETSNETYLGLTEADFRSQPFRRYRASSEDVMRADHRQFQLRHTIRFPAGFDVSTVGYYNGFSRNWYKLDSVNGVAITDILRDPDPHANALAVIRGGDSDVDALTVRANNRDYASAGVQSVIGAVTEAGATKHEIEIGLRYHADEEDRFQHEDGFQMLAGSMVLTSAGSPGSQSNRVSEATARAVFLQDRVEIGRWSLTPGVRYESINFARTDYGSDDPKRVAPERVRETHVDAWIPGLGIGYEVSSGVNLFGGVHRGFGPPGPGADEDTEAERSLNYELGLRLTSSHAEAQATVFYNDYDNILGRATLAVGDDSGEGELFNGGAARVSGFELALSSDRPFGSTQRWSAPVRLTYTYTSTEFGTSFESSFPPWGAVETGDELPYVPRHQLHAAIGIAHSAWMIELTADHVSVARTQAGRGAIPRGQGTDEYTVWSVGGEYTLSPRASLFAGVQNLTAAEYVVARRPAGARPGLPRTALAGIRISN